MTSITKTEIENTPFTIITDDEENKSFIVLGNNRVSNELFDSIEEAESYVNDKPWELILVSAAIFIEKTQQLKAEQTSINLNSETND